jgi:hypothetical protein
LNRVSQREGKNEEKRGDLAIPTALSRATISEHPHAIKQPCLLSLQPLLALAPGQALEETLELELVSLGIESFSRLLLLLSLVATVPNVIVFAVLMLRQNRPEVL